MNITPTGDSMKCYGTERNVHVTVQFLGDKDKYDCWKLQQAAADCLRWAQNQGDPLGGQHTRTSVCGQYSATIIYDLQ